MRELLVSIDEGTNPLENLPREESIFQQVERGSLPEVLRFWRNSECLVRGRAKSPKYGWYNEELAAEMGVPVLERSTGGGVVYQDLGNLNWSFFLHTSGAFLSPRTAFGRASDYVVNALRRAGYDASFAPPNRIEVSGRKVSGMAARSTVRTLLVHGTLLISTDLKRLNSLCVAPQGCPPVSNLTEWFPMTDHRSIEKEIVGVLDASGYRCRAIGALSR